MGREDSGEDGRGVSQKLESCLFAAREGKVGRDVGASLVGTLFLVGTTPQWLSCLCCRIEILFPTVWLTYQFPLTWGCPCLLTNFRHNSPATYLRKGCENAGENGKFLGVYSSKKYLPCLRTLDKTVSSPSC